MISHSMQQNLISLYAQPAAYAVQDQGVRKTLNFGFCINYQYQRKVLVWVYELYSTYVYNL